MKKFFSALVVALCAGAVVAGGLDKIVIKASNVSTTDASTVTTPVESGSKVTGWIEGVDFFVKTAAVTVSPVLTSSNSVSGVVRNIIKPGVIGTNTGYNTVRVNAVDIYGTASFTNDGQRITLLNESIWLAVTNASATNQDITAIVIYQRP